MFSVYTDIYVLRFFRNKNKYFSGYLGVESRYWKQKTELKKDNKLTYINITHTVAVLYNFTIPLNIYILEIILDFLPLLLYQPKENHFEEKLFLIRFRQI